MTVPMGIPITSSSSRLVEQVRETTAIFRDVNQAIGYEPFGGCVSGPEEGAMGVHFVNRAFLLDGELNVNEPEALIYELKNGRARLVGVEHIVLGAVGCRASRAAGAPSTNEALPQTVEHVGVIGEALGGLRQGLVRKSGAPGARQGLHPAPK
jgi:hypothetical protein